MSLTEDETGLTAQLTLAKRPCNVFGDDIVNLTVQVVYEATTRYVYMIHSQHIWPYVCDSLRVNIFDTEDQQFTIPPSVITRPPPPTISYKHKSDLIFNYESSPFAFWISRRSQPAASPIFDTRTKSLPTVPAPVTVNDSSMVLNAFPFVFEKQYLQVSLAS